MKKMLLSLVLLVGAATTQAQKLTDPAHWMVSAVKKLPNHQYQITLHLKLDDDWHTYAMEPGGDGSLLPLTFTIKPNTPAKLVGKPIANCEPITETVEGIDGPIHYFKGNVDFVLTVVAIKPTDILGVVGYQTCNNKMCLPPKKFGFKAIAD